MDEVIRVWAMPEFVHLDCYGGAHKHSCKASVHIRHRLYHHNFSAYLLKYMFEVKVFYKKKKTFKEVNEAVRKHFPYKLGFWCDQWNEGVNRFCDKIFVVGMFVCTTAVICFTFVLWSLTSYFLILKFYMSLFRRFFFWAPTRFPEVIRPNSVLYTWSLWYLHWSHYFIDQWIVNTTQDFDC